MRCNIYHLRGVVIFWFLPQLTGSTFVVILRSELMGKISSGDIDKHIGQQIRKVRKQKGYSLDKVGELLDVTQQQVSRYELGQQKLSAAQLFLLSIGFDVPASYFYQGLSSDQIDQETVLPSIGEDLPRYSATQKEQEDMLVRSFRLLSSNQQRDAVINFLNAFINK